MNRVFVTGAAGFIGSNLVDRLLASGIAVTGWDNFSTGQELFLENALKHPNFRFLRGDNLDLEGLINGMKNSNAIFHLGANADVRFGLEDPSRDLQQNTIATFNVLEAMRTNGIKTIAFSSTGSVYGEADLIPTPEDAPFPIQTSLYGASKLAGEGLIQAYCEGYGFEGYVFRFVSVLGERYTHGHVFDFYKQLIEHPEFLQVLGDGSQRKSYLYIADCLDAMLHAVKVGAARNPKHRMEVYNLGTPEYCRVTDSIDWICKHLHLNPKLEFGGGDRGWVGDNPFIFLETQKIQKTGWHARVSIRDGIIRTLEWLQKNQWVLARR
jgi:UDP-glucose 4-epimerase